MNILIIGLPRCGKTTAADKMATEETVTISTDGLISQYEWSAFSDKVCDLLKQEGPWIIEGCSAVRGLRKYLREGNKLTFDVVWMDQPYVPLVGKQIGFAASLTSIWEECKDLINANLPNR